MSASLELMSDSPDRTRAIGRTIGGWLSGGDFVALSGPLGAGKTQLVKGLAEGLGVSPAEPVVSPTFVLIREYGGRLRLYHLDAYRLSGVDELMALGLDELRSDPQAVVALEWSDRVPEAVPPEALLIELSHPAGAGGPGAKTTANVRRLRLQFPGQPRFAELAGLLAGLTAAEQ
jgi:tRNA threonylcarbamoyladenosine biosynthesis protein TsaE